MPNYEDTAVRTAQGLSEIAGAENNLMAQLTRLGKVSSYGHDVVVDITAFTNRMTGDNSKMGDSFPDEEKVEKEQPSIVETLSSAIRNVEYQFNEIRRQKDRLQALLEG